MSHGQYLFLSKKNTSGLSGVSYNKATKKWAAYIFINKERKFLGYFETKEEAAKARVDAGGLVYLEKQGKFPEPGMVPVITKLLDRKNKQ
jgi:hypothetical protein